MWFYQLKSFEVLSPTESIGKDKLLNQIVLMWPTHLPNENKEDISEATAKSEKEKTGSKSLGRWDFQQGCLALESLGFRCLSATLGFKSGAYRFKCWDFVCLSQKPSHATRVYFCCCFGGGHGAAVGKGVKVQRVHVLHATIRRHDVNCSANILLQMRLTTQNVQIHHNLA